MRCNFWGSPWAKTNALSGGAAPSSFKGSRTELRADVRRNVADDAGQQSSGPAHVGAANTGGGVVEQHQEQGSTIYRNVKETRHRLHQPGYVGPSPATRHGNGRAHALQELADHFGTID